MIFKGLSVAKDCVRPEIMPLKMMMKNYELVKKITTWPYIPNHSYSILIIGGSGSSKINVLLNLIQHQ